MIRTLKYWIKEGRWYRWPWYIYHTVMFWPRHGSCPCIDGSNDYYWNGYFKKPKDCGCGG